MKQLIIDRFEGKYAICEDKDQKYYAIEAQELPQGGQGRLRAADHRRGRAACWTRKRPQRRRQRILDKQRKAFGG